MRSLSTALPTPRPALTWRHLPSLVASVLPAAATLVGLAVVREHPRFAWISRAEPVPVEVVVAAIAGTVATAAGVLDWVHHRASGIRIGPNERRAELLALTCGGLPLFGLLAASAVSPRPQVFLLPVLVALMATVAMVAYDEVAFHRRRCQPYETTLHRLLTGGHAIAFLAVAHFCFVRGTHG